MRKECARVLECIEQATDPTKHLHDVRTLVGGTRGLNEFRKADLVRVYIGRKVCVLKEHVPNTAAIVSEIGVGTSGLTAIAWDHRTARG